jgi:biotin carboxyl carrier protein
MSVKGIHNPGRFIELIAVFLLAFSCTGRKEAELTGIKARTPVTVVTPQTRDLKETIAFTAVSSYLVKHSVRSPVSGTVESAPIALGGNVKPGTLLFMLKTREAAALHNISPGDSSLNFKGIIKSFSPVNGVISSILHQAGDFVQEGDELAVVSDSKSLVFITEVPFEMKGIVEKDGDCILRLPDSTLINGVVKRRLSEMNIQDQTVSYIVEPLTGRSLPQNLIASALFDRWIVRNVQVLPRQAILGNETQTEFWIMKVINDSTAVRVPVSKGLDNGNEVGISWPILLPGDRILVTGNYGLPDTARITIER